MMEPSPRNQLDIARLADILASMSATETKRYVDLESAVARPVRGNDRHILTAAIKAAEKATGARFEVVRREGVKRLSAADLAGIGAVTRGKIGRAARRAFKRLDAPAYNLSPEETRIVSCERAVLSIISDASRAETFRKVAAVKTASDITPGDVSRILAGLQ